MRHALEFQQPDADQVIAARQRAGLTQAQAAGLVGLRSVARWGEYECALRNIDAVRWTMFLLLTAQHPELRLTRLPGAQKTR